MTDTRITATATASREGTDSLFAGIDTQRAIRRFRPDPVPDELLWKVMHAATQAPSGSNRQPWGFVVVREAAARERIARALEAYLGENDALRGYFERGSQSEDRGKRLMLSGALELARHMERAPVLVVPCLYPANQPLRFNDGSSIFPAVQNLLLAARGVGLGTVLTTFNQGIEPTLREVLGLPDDAAPVALIPLGFPDANFGPKTRKPLESIVHWDRWGAQRDRG